MFMFLFAWHVQGEGVFHVTYTVPPFASSLQIRVFLHGKPVGQPFYTVTPVHTHAVRLRSASAIALFGGFLDVCYGFCKRCVCVSVGMYICLIPCLLSPFLPASPCPAARRCPCLWRRVA